MSEKMRNKPGSNPPISVSTSQRSRNTKLAATLAIAGMLAPLFKDKDHSGESTHVAQSNLDAVSVEQSDPLNAPPAVISVPNTADSLTAGEINRDLADSNNTEEQVRGEVEDPYTAAVETGSAVFDDMVANGSYDQYFGQWNNFWGYIRGECRRRGVSESLVEHCVSGVQSAIGDEKAAHIDRSQTARDSGNHSESNREIRIATQLEALSSPSAAFAEAMSRGDVRFAMEIYHSAPAVDLMGHERIDMLVPNYSFGDLLAGANTLNNTLLQVWDYLGEADKADILNRIRYVTDRLFVDHSMVRSDDQRYIREGTDRWNSLMHQWFPGQMLEPAPETEEETES